MQLLSPLHEEPTRSNHECSAGVLLQTKVGIGSSQEGFDPISGHDVVLDSKVSMTSALAKRGIDRPFTAGVHKLFLRRLRGVETYQVERKVRSVQAERTQEVMNGSNWGRSAEKPRETRRI